MADFTNMTNEEVKAHIAQKEDAAKEEGKKEGEKRAKESLATFTNVTRVYGGKILPPHEYLQWLSWKVKPEKHGKNFTKLSNAFNSLEVLRSTSKPIKSDTTTGEIVKPTRTTVTWACDIILATDVNSEFMDFAMKAIREFLQNQKAEFDERRQKRERDEAADSPSKGGKKSKLPKVDQSNSDDSSAAELLATLSTGEPTSDELAAAAAELTAAVAEPAAAEPAADPKTYAIDDPDTYAIDDGNGSKAKIPKKKGNKKKEGK